MTRAQPTTLHVAALTNVGKRREVNEDCIAVGASIHVESMSAPLVDALSLSSPCFCLVADGMGGHPAGDIASRMAVEFLITELQNAATSDDALIAAVRRANLVLYAEMKRTPEVSGMGTTIAGLAASATELVAFNVGDSRIYRVRNGVPEQLSTDDTEHIMTSFLALEFPMRALSQCLGGFAGIEEVTPHVVREPAQPNAEYLICSDGLHDMLSDAEIAGCLVPDLRDSVRTLFERAMDAGGIDNVSIILVRLE
jgi:serine/threonine protein phosphatase PrpC